MNTKFKEYQIQDYEGMLRFVKGGNAIFTIKNEKTGNRFTYKFKQNQNDLNVFWVYMLCMSNNDDQTNYKFLGGFSEEKSFINSPKAQVKDTMGVLAIEWFCNALISKKIPKNVKVYHLSKCGRCGRSLTTPESIISGFGPECLKHEIREGNTQPVKYSEQQDDHFNNSVKSIDQVESMISKEDPEQEVKKLTCQQSISNLQKHSRVKIFFKQLKLKLFVND